MIPYYHCLSHYNYCIRFFFFFWSQPHTSCKSCLVWSSWVRLLLSPLSPRTQSLVRLTKGKVIKLSFWNLKWEMPTWCLTKGGDKIKIKINKHKEDECSVWRGVVVKKKNWAIKNNLFPDGSWKLTYVYQNKNKNSITNNYLFVVNVFRIFVARNVFLVFLAVQTVIDRILLTIYWIDFQRCLSFINWAFHL